MPDSLTLGVVGFGWFAELLHDRVLTGLDRLDTVAVCDPDPARRTRAAELLGAQAFASMEEMLAGSDCQAVAIFTPHSTHRELVEQAAAAGRHIFCEKAMAVTATDCVAMIAAAREARVELMVGHMQKLFPAYRRVAEIVASGRYGAPVAAHVNGLHWCPVYEGWWRRKADCGGLLYWTGVHDVDTLRHVIGGDVESVFAVTGPDTDDDTDYEDSIAATLRFESGAVATLHVAQHDPLRSFEESFSMQVLCKQGAVAFDPGTNRVVHAARAGHERFGPAVESFVDHEESMFVAYREEFAHFASVVLDGVASRLPAEDGLRCVEILEAVYASAASHEPAPVHRADVTAGPPPRALGAPAADRGS